MNTFRTSLLKHALAKRAQPTDEYLPHTCTVSSANQSMIRWLPGVRLYARFLARRLHGSHLAPTAEVTRRLLQFQLFDLLWIFVQQISTYPQHLNRTSGV